AVPVPISATALACTADARKASAAPAPGPTGTTPTSSERRRAAARWSSSLRCSSAYARLAAVVMIGSSVGLTYVQTIGAGPEDPGGRAHENGEQSGDSGRSLR